MRRRSIALCAALAATALVAWGTVDPAPSVDPGGPRAPVASNTTVANVPVAPTATIIASPAIGAAGVSPVVPVAITVVHGAIEQVALTNPDGKVVAGQLAGDRTSFRITEPLGYGKTYTWSGRVNGADGAAAPITGSFTTLTPARHVSARLNTGDGQTYGVAMPIALTFDVAVTDRAAVEQALSVQTSKPTEGAWAWLDDRTVHWRPKVYWQPDTAVTVTAKLYGVPFGENAYGADDLTAQFAIGRSQIARADTQTHRFTVIRDGEQVADYPASYGLDSDPERVTRGGTHVVMEKTPATLFSNPKFDYTDLPVQWAVRVSNNGEFIHSAPWSVWAQGTQNVSHGCVNLAPDDAIAYYQTAMTGDPVEVIGSTQPLSGADGDYYDWTLTWPEWTSKSALTT
ncbi:L,D-transpeptidase [Mycobacterium hubeiense]|uniref:L,D-transpeptidase n=1 Tax=Mycobacterium hubeiense TaxID=1867256 RepID=UPI000C7EA3BD|nr:Ig-like domain-containing protein [Mycobacterium sp. QGD 101]